MASPLWMCISAGLVVVLAACAERPALPNLEEIYAEYANGAQAANRPPLIVVPGTLGSRLVDGRTGQVIWGGGERGISVDPDERDGARLMAMPIPGPETALAQLSDGIEPAGVLEVARANVLGFPVMIDVYRGIGQTLLAGGFREEARHCGRLVSDAGPAAEHHGTSCTLPGPPGSSAPNPSDLPVVKPEAVNGTPGLRFDYDWRRDLPALAIELGAFIKSEQQRIAADRSARSGHKVDPSEIRFDLVAHSMGGLITRYYLMYGPTDLPEDGSLPPITWLGAKDFNRVVFVAPPNGGSVIAFETLINGKDLGPFQPSFPGYLLATHASTWQLLPRVRHQLVRWESAEGPPVDNLFDPALWEAYGWGLADPEAREFLEWLVPEVLDPSERRRRALDHQARLLARAEKFQRAMDRWTDPPDDLKLFLVVGGGFRTSAIASVDRMTGDVRLVRDDEGDGVVTRASALLDERVAGDNGSGVNSPLSYDTVLFLPDEHVELTRNPVFGDNLLFWLLAEPRRSERLQRADPPAALGAAYATPARPPSAAPALSSPDAAMR